MAWVAASAAFFVGLLVGYGICHRRVQHYAVLLEKSNAQHVAVAKAAAAARKGFEKQVLEARKEGLAISSLNASVKEMAARNREAELVKEVARLRADLQQARGRLKGAQGKAIRLGRRGEVEDKNVPQV